MVRELRVREVFAKNSRSEFDRVVTRIRGARSLELGVKFFLRDHKLEMLLQAVISENGTWQKVVSGFIQKGLSFVPLESTLLPRNTAELIENLRDVEIELAFLCERPSECR